MDNSVEWIRLCRVELDHTYSFCCLIFLIIKLIYPNITLMSKVCPLINLT